MKHIDTRTKTGPLRPMVEKKLGIGSALLKALLLLAILLTPGVDFAERPFSLDALWDDGLAEVGTYQAKKKIYGKLWNHRAVLITVKEDFDKAYYTKADPPLEGKDLLPVLKLNYFARIETGNYPYQYLMSVFVRRDDPWKLVKLTVSSQEWCGNTFKEFKAWQQPCQVVFHSYFSGEGDGEREIEIHAGDLLWEQLFVSLRSLPFGEGFHQSFRLLDSQMNNKARPPRWRDALLEVVGREKVSVPAGEFSCWQVGVTGGGEEMDFWFEEARPHRLIRYADSQGQEMQLEEIARRAYWKR